MSYYSEAIARHIVTHTAAEGKEDYQKFFQAALKKFGVSSPAGLSPDKKKDFFNYIEKGYKAKDESTKAFGNTVRKQDLRQQLSMISDKDKATLGKLAALMRGAKKKKPNEALTKEDIAIMVREAYIEENKVTCPKCEGKGCDHCDGKGYHMKENKGLWHNINAKKKRGEKSSPKGSKAYKQAKAAGQKINRKEDVDEIFGPMDRALKQTLKDPKSGKDVTVGSIKNQGEKRYGAALVKKANDIFKKAMEKEKAVKAKTKKMQGEDVKKYNKSLIDRAVSLAKKMGGNMTGASAAIEKMSKGLSKNGKVKYALQKYNEDVTLPAEIKRYMNKFVSSLKGSGLNRRRQLVVLAGVIDALGVDEQMLMKLVRKIKKGMKDD